MVNEKKRVSVKEEKALSYQLKKFEVLMKRKAGHYCLLDWNTGRIIASGEQRKVGGDKLVKNKKFEEVITWLKETNARLRKEDPLGGKILLTYSRLGREAKRLRKIKQLKENKTSFKKK